MDTKEEKKETKEVDIKNVPVTNVAVMVPEQYVQFQTDNIYKGHITFLINNGWVFLVLPSESSLLGWLVDEKKKLLQYSVSRGIFPCAMKYITDVCPGAYLG